MNDDLKIPRQKVYNEDVETNVEMLESTADQVIETFTYVRQLDEEEVQKMESELAQKSVELRKLEEKLKEIQDEYKAKMKPYKNRIGILVNGPLKTHTEEVTERAFLFFFQDQGLAGYYNELGELVHDRRLHAYERQQTIFSALKPSEQTKTGTND